MAVTKIDAVPAVPELTGNLMKRATYRLLPELSNLTPFAPNGGVRPVPGPSSRSLLHALKAPPSGLVFQITPLKESDT
jgi:hypothetical protein